MNSKSPKRHFTDQAVRLSLAATTSFSGRVSLLTWIILATIPVGFLTSARADALVGPNPKIKVQPVVPFEVTAFPLTNVRLLDGPFKHAMQLDENYLLSLDVDRLLHNFRVNAGLPS